MSLYIPTFLRKKVLGLFAKFFHINLDEMQGDFSDYSTFDAFFTRPLKPTCRPICQEKNRLISPVDGVIQAFGCIEDNQLIQAKGLYYSLQAFCPIPMVKQFQYGSFITIYLSPSDCHRIFSPSAGILHSSTHVPGMRHVVREPLISNKPNLYVENERVITVIATDLFGFVGIVKVAALNVGNISLTFDPVFESTISSSEITRKQYAKKTMISKGDWISSFHLGSTVVLLTEKKLTFKDIVVGTTVKYGQHLTG